MGNDPIWAWKAWSEGVMRCPYCVVDLVDRREFCGLCDCNMFDLEEIERERVEGWADR